MKKKIAISTIKDRTKIWMRGKSKILMNHSSRVMKGKMVAIIKNIASIISVFLKARTGIN